MTRRYTYTTCLAFGTDGEADYSELDATISYVVRQGCSAAITAYGPVANLSDDPEIEDIRVEQIDSWPAGSMDDGTIEAVLAKFETGDHDAALLAAAAKVSASLLEQAA